jgi:hypothetical protein
MVELRWEERVEQVAHDPRIGTTVRVLQFRIVTDVEENIDDEFGATVGVRYVKGWSRWMDVPTVSADRRDDR